MKRWFWIWVLVWSMSIVAQDDAPVFDYLRTVNAGDTWGLAVSNATCNTIEAQLVNGFALYTESLTVRDGAAAWRVDLNQAGESVLQLRCDDHMHTDSIQVLAGEVVRADVFPLANQITAYSIGQTTILGFLSDAQGNPARPTPNLELYGIYPDNARVALSPAYANGLLRADVTSIGTGGRIRGSLLVDGVTLDTFELHQNPTELAQVAIDINPTCVLSDGRDRVLIQVRGVDRYGQPPLDGTSLQMAWESGRATLILRGGLGTLEIPTPTETGTLTFAVIGFPTTATLQVRDPSEGCGYES